MKVILIILTIYIIGLILMFIIRFRYYNRVVKREFKSHVPKYAFIDAYKWPSLFVFIFIIIGAIIFDDIKYRKVRKETLDNFKKEQL